MKGIVLLVLLIILLGCAAQKTIEQAENIGKPTQKEADNMKIWSNDFKEGEMIPSKFTCQGENINPHLAWNDVPAGVKSFALIFDDPDAPGGTWVHWLVKDISPETKDIPQNSVPGAQVVNSFGKESYGGPCPPALHRYFFRLYALNVETFEANSKADFYKQAQRYAIAKAELMGRYEKS